MMETQESASVVQLLGAGAFGALIGWFVYYINRYRKGDVQFSDLTTVISIVGGAGILSLFEAKTDLFGAYGIGLFLGFFAYFVSLLLLIRSSDNFSADFLLDGRRRILDGSGFYIPGDFIRPPMDVSPMIARDLSTAQAQASTEALRIATLDAQRSLAALTKATHDSDQQRSANLNPSPASGD
jgi:hypothetical protein